MKNIQLIFFGLAFLFLLNYWLTSSSSSKNWTVYGSKNCGWTNKQLEHMDSNNISYEFIDCDKNKQKCVGMEGFPTLKNSNGKTIVGFNTDL
jgi:hypothetical protein